MKKRRAAHQADRQAGRHARHASAHSFATHSFATVSPRLLRIALSSIVEHCAEPPRVLAIRRASDQRPAAAGSDTFQRAVRRSAPDTEHNGTGARLGYRFGCRISTDLSATISPGSSQRPVQSGPWETAPPPSRIPQQADKDTEQRQIHQIQY